MLLCCTHPQAAADYYGLKIYVITSYKDRYVVVIEPSKRKSNRLLYLSFWAEVSGEFLDGQYNASCSAPSISTYLASGD